MSVVKTYHNSGFSVIELIAVIVLLAILGIVALGRFGDQGGFAARGFFDDTVAAVSFAQKLAISSGCNVQVNIAGNVYQLRQSATCTTAPFKITVMNPSNRSNPYASASIPAGFTLTGGVITFNARGQRVEPSSNFDLTDGATLYRFRVHATTGFVEVLIP